MAAITTISRKSGVRYRVTIDMPGVRTFSGNFRTKKNACAWAKKTEGSLEEARIQGNNLAHNLTLYTLNHRTGEQSKFGYRDRAQVVEGSLRTGVVLAARKVLDPWGLEISGRVSGLSRRAQACECHDQPLQGIAFLCL